MWYETSRDVAVVAFPFPLGSPQARDAALSFARRAAREVERGVRRSLKVFGDRALVSQLLFEFPDLGEVYYTSPLKSGDFAIDDPNHLTRNRVAARAARRAAREGYAISRNGDAGLSMAHLACLRSFVAHRELADVDGRFFSALTLWASRPDVRLFGVVKAGRLVSFFLIHEWSSRLAFFLGSFAEAKRPFVGDAIMDFLHRRYVGTGGRVLLGPAVDPRNEAFKRKWARDVGNGPTMGAIFGGTDDDEVPRHLHVWWAAAASDMETSSSLSRADPQPAD